MARISGVNIPTAKKIHIALTYIFGIGPKIANDLCEQASIDKSKRVICEELTLYYDDRSLGSDGLSTTIYISAEQS